MQKRNKFMLILALFLIMILLSTNDLYAQVQLVHFQTDVQPESCIICHQQAGVKHQEIYDSYSDQSAFEVTIDSVSSVDMGDGTYDVTLTFSIMKNKYAVTLA